MNVANYWNKAISFEQYKQEVRDIISNGTDKPREEYYSLNLSRIDRILKTYKPDEVQLADFHAKKFEGKILIITEGWCADAAQIVPVIELFFGQYLPVRCIYRDDNNLIDSFLTNGGKSIPIVLLLNNQDEVVAQWGPRPAFGTPLLQRFKSESATYPKEQFLLDLQKAYNKDKGFSIVEEIIAKM